jgi:hypothetical protein
LDSDRWLARSKRHGHTAEAEHRVHPLRQRGLGDFGVDLASDPGELYNLMATKMDMGWMLGVVLKFVADYQKSIAKYPNIKTGEEFNGY